MIDLCSTFCPEPITTWTRPGTGSECLSRPAFSSGHSSACSLAFLGIVMPWLETGSAAGASLGNVAGPAFASGIAGGLFLGLLLPRSFRKKMARHMDLLYARDPQLVPQPLGERSFRYSLLATWERADAGLAPHPVGGTLYMDREGVLFVPHHQSLQADREVIGIGPLESLELAVVTGQLNWLTRMVWSRPASFLEIRSEAQVLRLLVPKVAKTSEKVEAAIQELIRMDPQADGEKGGQKA